MKPGIYRDVARLLVEGDGTPRSREALLRDVESALNAAHAAGSAEGARSVRAAAVQHALAIARGQEQEAAARARTLEQDLAEILRERR